MYTYTLVVAQNHRTQSIDFDTLKKLKTKEELPNYLGN